MSRLAWWSLALPVLGCASAVVEVPADASPQRFAPQRPVEQTPDPIRPGADGRVSVVVGTLFVDGGSEGPLLAPSADLTGVAEEVRHNAGSLQRCYEERLRAAPHLAGSVLIHAHITPTGEVDGQCITKDELQDAGVVACVNELIARGRYPTSTRTVDVTFPFVFTPPAG